MKKLKVRSFTLIEMIIVIAIIALADSSREDLEKVVLGAGGTILNERTGVATVQVAGNREIVDAFITAISVFEVCDLARSGIVTVTEYPDS